MFSLNRRFAARPNQVIGAVIVLDQAGVNGRRLDAVIVGAVAASVIGNKLNLDVKGQVTPLDDYLIVSHIGILLFPMLRCVAPCKSVTIK